MQIQGVFQAKEEPSNIAITDTTAIPEEMDILATKVQFLFIHLGFPFVSLIRLTPGISVEEEEEDWGLLESNSVGLWLSSVVDSSSGVITVAIATNLGRIHRDVRMWWS